MNKGDLVWIPSDITLLQFNEGTVDRWITVKEPYNVLLAEKGDVYFKVFHEGEWWHARKSDVFERGV